ncbi:MAG: diguanylate cyclase [Gemmatimonadaceae bacterium]|nr:diguanylate cyclase [Gemmatimonadaceae bacterium]
MAKSIAIYFSPDGQQMPDLVATWLSGQGLQVETLRDPDDLMAMSLRGRPRAIVMDARGEPTPSLEVIHRMKADSYTAVVPCLLLSGDDDAAFAAVFEAGADEVIRARMSEGESRTRLGAMLRRSDRDLVVHPSTRLPGAVEIEGEIQRRLVAESLFAMCYADLDHFKEYNDRYSYYDGDRVIRILAKILHDVVKGMCGEAGFVGHIGGDDFICIIPSNDVHPVCAEIVAIFDTLIPFQYSEADRRSGYFFGKDRRGQLHRVPLMTVSIGVVTNERRVFTHAAQVSELATEMKSYAKTLPGSVFSVDRRGTAGGEEDEGPAGHIADEGPSPALRGEGK